MTTPREGRRRVVWLHEGTNISAAVSPDAATVAFDLVSAVWLVPVTGGRARRVTDDRHEAAQPSWSPDGRRLVFQSSRAGSYHLWTVAAEGGAAQRLTQGSWNDREPRWSPDGRSIAFVSDRDGAHDLWLLAPGNGRVVRVTRTAARLGAPAWSPDAARLAFTVDDTAIDVLDLATGERVRAVQASSGTTLHGPAYTCDGATLVYTRVSGPRSELVLGTEVVTQDEDVFGFPPSWLSPNELVYAADGRLRRRRLDTHGGEPTGVIPFVAEVGLDLPGYRRRRPWCASTNRTGPLGHAPLGIVAPALSPDGRAIAFRALGGLWHGAVSDPPHRIPTGGAFATDPDWSPDGTRLVFAGDLGGTIDLWSFHIGSGVVTRLPGPDGGRHAPRWSPDGGRVAYLDEAGAGWVLELATGDARRVIAGLDSPGRPAWSPRGDRLVLAAVRPASPFGVSGANEMLVIDLCTGRHRYQPVAPGTSISSRDGAGPLWLPRPERIAVLIDGRAHLIPVAPDGTPSGEPQRVTDEVADALALGAGGQVLLYLSNGVLRTLNLSTGERRHLPLPLSWRPRRYREPVVLRPGAVWDGVSRALRTGVDIVVDGDRIATLAPPERCGGPVVELPGLTAMPGLIDAHVHWHLRGAQWGDRLGRVLLAYGVTTVRSAGDPAYRIVETREATASGGQVGPRVLACGEALDGRLLYYPFVRSVTTAEGVERELSRAVALACDLVKTYVWLPPALSRRAAEIAHRHGLPITSHYLHPNLAWGFDGQEHTAGGDRVGYSRTASRTGLAYQDAVELLAASGMWVSSTLLYAQEQLARDRSLVEDRRTRLLFPPWDYHRLRDRAVELSGPAGEALAELNRRDVDMLLRIHRRGGLVIVGTDLPVDAPGVSMHTNLRALVQHGFTPYEALTAATTNAAAALNLTGRLGVLAAGHLADIAFVAGNPLADVGCAAATRYVMAGGVLHGVDDLLGPVQRRKPVTEVGPVG